MIKELEKLSLTMDFITPADAKSLIGDINEPIAHLLNAHIIDILWQRMGTGGVILDPFYSYDTTPRKGAKPYQICDTSSSSPTGIWTWVYENRKPLWIETILSKDLNKPVKNEATGDQIDPKYLNIWGGTDSIMAIPLKCRDTVFGIYSVESAVSGKFSIEIKELLELLSYPISSLIWKADAWNFNQNQTSQVIDLFTSSIPDRINSIVVKELEKISWALDFISTEDAKKILGGIHLKLASMLGAHIVDALWKQEGQGGIILNPFVSYDSTSRSGAKPYQIKDNSQNEPTGIWSWAFENRKPIWIEELQTKNLSEPVINKATEDQIEPRYLRFWKTTDSILAIPLECRDTVWGIYSLELPESGILNEDINKLIKQISKSLATIIWKADAHTFNKEQSNEAVKRFCASWSDYKVENLLTSYRTGMIVRPFDAGFNAVEECIKRFFENHHICAQRYIPRPGTTEYVIDDIMEKVSSAHFGVVDITGCNYNVMLELGMMMILKKKLILLRRSDDRTDIPFDINNFNYYSYEERPGPEIWVQDPGTQQYRPIEDTLKPFIGALENDPIFRSAKRWIGQKNNIGY